jgi:hypothetical protein
MTLAWRFTFWNSESRAIHELELRSGDLDHVARREVDPGTLGRLTVYERRAITLDRLEAESIAGLADERDLDAGAADARLLFGQWDVATCLGPGKYFHRRLGRLWNRHCGRDVDPIRTLDS